METEKKTNKKYNIKTTDRTDYERSAQSTTSAEPKPLDKEKLSEVDSVESIGRYDDFAFLKISPRLYDKKEGGYGIPFKKSIHFEENEVRIRPHQQEAAKLFLSDLRGFGLLADCVGSGKTYEACVVISELAVRGRIQNLLIIVPDEALLKKWTGVLETEFGYGKGKLQRIDRLESIKKKSAVAATSAIKPEGAYIMTYKAFTASGAEAISSYLFDLIVVDEAHNLCKVDKNDVTSMYYLSLMMQTKKKNKVPFCLLLTATPHSGNLTHMFNLWYFIRRKGGIPECFKEKGNPGQKERAEYAREKAFYLNVVCKGATTVAEYVAKAQCEFLIGMSGESSNVRDRFFAAFTVERSKDGSRTKKTFPAITYEEYLALKDYQKKDRAQCFLDDPKNEDVRRMALDSVNHTYTNVVMRSIMVRRRNEYSVKRNAYSYFFLPIDKAVEVEEKPEKKKGIPTFMVDGVSYAADAIDDLFSDEGKYVKALFDDNPHFKANGGAGEGGFAKFYYEVFNEINGREAALHSDFVRVLQIPCQAESEEKTVFLAKCKKFVALLKEIRRRDANHRVIVFFDYKKEENVAFDESLSTWKKLTDYLTKNAPDLVPDIIHGDLENIDTCIAQYDANPNAILFAENQKFTEGQDLQNGNIVINFEVPVDPLTVDQRIGRVYRMGQAEDEVEVHSFATMSRLDGYCLGYFASIGILSDTEGDATILSGCNSDSMKVLRCPSCEDVSLIYESDFEELLPECEECKEKGITGIKMDAVAVTDSDGVRREMFICKRDPSHRKEIPAEHPLRCTCNHAPLREAIVINEFVCKNNPRHRIKRAKDKGYDYVCMSHKRNKMMRTQDENGNILVGCSKFCAFKNCPYSRPGCVLREKIDEIIGEEEARVICASCPQWDKCECRIDNGDRANDKSVANSCHFCMLYKKSGRVFPCMQPYTINFGKDYQSGRCPECNGELEQIKTNTFETFIRSRYENDRSFCYNFIREMNKTLTIKEILRFK